MADPLSLTSLIVQLLVATKDFVEYIADMKRSPDERLQLTNEVKNLVLLLEDLSSRIDAAQPTDPWAENLRVLARAGGPMDRFKDTLSRLEKSLPSQSSMASLKQRFTWSLEKKQMKEWLDEAERFKTHLILAVQNDQVAIQSDISKLSSMDTTMNSVLQNIVELGITSTEQASKIKLEEITNWLSPLDFRGIHNAFYQLHLNGSNEWVLNSDIFQNWCAGSPKILCCDGETGSGKTILVSQIIQHLKTRYPDFPVLYAYCDYERGSPQSLDNLLGALLKQLVYFEGQIPGDIQSLYARYEKQGTKITISEMISILKSRLAIYDSSFIIVDGLDEIPGIQDMLLRKLANLQGNSKMFFTMTAIYLEAFLSKMQSLGFHSPVGMHFQSAPQDLGLYVREQLSTLPRYLRDDTEMAQLIMDHVVNGAEGRFLIAVLCINLLRDCTTKKEGRIVLQRLINQDNLSALNKLYEQTLERIQVQDSGFRKLAERTLGWLGWSYDGFDDVLALQHALAIEPGTPELDNENIPDVETIISACLGIVVFDSASKVIRFIHRSAATSTRSYFFKQSIPIHCDIIDACLTYLSFDAFRMGPCSDDEELQQRFKEYPFLTYASLYWGLHAGQCVESIAIVDDRCMKLRSSVLEYLKLTENRNSAAQVEYGKTSDHVDGGNYPRDLTALHVVASFGLTSIMNHLVEDGIDCNARDSYGCTPLNRAARRGHEWAVRLLVERGADIHAQDNYGQDALHMAAWNGHALAVEMLIDHGANPNSKDDEGQTALHKAATQGHQEIVIYMTKRGADLSIRDKSDHSPVDLAIREGHEALKWPMLQSWVKDLERDDYRRPALHQAVRYGTTTQVEQILNEGYNIDSLDFWDRTALLEAARCGLLAMTALLIERGADVTLEGEEYYGTASRENAASLAADSCYLNWHGEKGKEALKKGKRREDAIAIIQMVLKKLIATQGAVNGINAALSLPNNQEKITLAASETQDDANLLELGTKLVLEEAGYRESKRPRSGGSRFE